jgi:ribonuclease HII
MPSKKSSVPEQLGLSFDVIGLVAGVDEAGRGPLAGPVVAAAVILDELKPIRGLKDSKQLTALARERLYDEIRAKALCCSIAEASVEEIDTGDAKVKSISAASILAKVHRDRLCLSLHEAHPQYGFDGHKGYATAEHLAALRAHGACVHHRRSFAPVREALEGPP